MLSNWINPEILDNTDKFRKVFSGNKPFKHVVINNFLQADKAEMMLRALRGQEFEHKESDLFSLNQTPDFEHVKDEKLKSFYMMASSKDFAEFMQQLTGLDVQSGALDLAGSLYKSGDYLLCHDDQVEDRKIAYILYLSKNFSEEDGARFVLFNNKTGEPGDESKKYLPEWNSLMIFEVSKISFHSVEENFSDKDRYAIGGWLH